MAIIFIILYFLLKSLANHINEKAKRTIFRYPRAVALEIVIVLDLIYTIVQVWNAPPYLSTEEVGGLIGESMGPVIYILIGMGICNWLRKRKAAASRTATPSETPLE
jgi:hypothetical protein